MGTERIQLDPHPMRQLGSLQGKISGVPSPGPGSTEAWAQGSGSGSGSGMGRVRHFQSWPGPEPQFLLSIPWVSAACCVH